ncbi:MAG: hypothetical protein L3J82_02620, partial [Planctomycetes bacterium]|nr:hypothetical protein [Planctomycetota bacterium]
CGIRRVGCGGGGRAVGVQGWISKLFIKHTGLMYMRDVYIILESGLISVKEDLNCPPFGEQA